MKYLDSPLKLSRKTLLIVTAVLAAVGLVLIWRAYAAGPEIYLSSDSQEVTQGSQLQVVVRADTVEETVNAIQANLNYPADKLELTGIDYSGSAFDIQAEETTGNGIVRVARGTVTPVSGELLIATLNFEVVMSSGSATIEFTDGTALVRNTDATNILTLASGQTYTVAEPDPEPEPTPPPPEPTPPPPEPTPPPPSPTPAPADATLSIKPSSQELENGLSAPIEIRLNTNEAMVNAVQTNLSYPADKLRFVSIDTSGADFGIEAESSSEDGLIKIARGSIESKQGDNLLVATVTFRALVGSGTAVVDFAEGSAVVRSSDNVDILNIKQKGEYVLTASPEDTDPSPPPPSPTPSPSPSPSPSPAPSPSPSPPSPTPSPPPAAVTPPSPSPSPSPFRRAVTRAVDNVRDLPVINELVGPSTTEDSDQEEIPGDEDKDEEDVRFTTDSRTSIAGHVGAVLDTGTGKVAAAMLAVSVVTIGGIMLSSAFASFRASSLARHSGNIAKRAVPLNRGGQTIYPESPDPSGDQNPDDPPR